MRVLKQFLTATTLEERFPLIETRTSGDELASSVLARPLPETSRIEIDSQENSAAEQMVDFYYQVDFVASDRSINPQVILVRIRGPGEPKVVVDPFLDLFGGRLANFIKAPRDQLAEFQVIVYALASCNENSVPNRDEKLTLKLLPQDHASEIGRAYFSKHSRVHELLEDGTYLLSYGKAKACTVLLGWNVTEDASKPYLEVRSISDLDWDP